MDKLTSAINGINQMAMYVYDAYREQGLSDQAAKEKVADHMAETHRKFVDQAGINRKLTNPKSVERLAGQFLELFDHAIKETAMEADIPFKMVRQKAQEIVEAIKKG